MKRKLSALTVALAILLAACMPSQEQIDELVKSAEETAIAQVTIVPAATQSVDQIVQATFQALTAQASIPTPAPTATPGAGNNPQTGSISGSLSYPSEGIPPLVVVAFRVDSDVYYWMQTAQNQSAYQMDGLPPGSYHVAAYTLDGGLSARYDQF